MKELPSFPVELRSAISIGDTYSPMWSESACRESVSRFFTALRPTRSWLSNAFRRGLVQTISTLLLVAFVCYPPKASPQDNAQVAISLPNFAAPAATGTLGNKSPEAINVIVAYRQAVSSAGWQDLHGIGTITYPTGSPHAAELYLSGSDRTRLDITTDSGPRSVRLRGSSGSFQDEKGNSEALLAPTSNAGLLAFPRLWIGPLGTESVSLSDQGTYTAGVQNLRKITIEYPQFSGNYAAGDPTSATDLYFDPNSHLLLFSVDAVSFPGTAGQAVIRVTSYGSYQQFGQIMLPTLIQQALSGQTEWTLNLSQINTNVNPPDSTFSF